MEINKKMLFTFAIEYGCEYKKASAVAVDWNQALIKVLQSEEYKDTSISMVEALSMKEANQENIDNYNTVYKNKPTYIRLLQHDKSDGIRIGASSCIFGDLDKAEKDCIDTYEKECSWCGGFKSACEKYYKRIALVDADTLEVVRVIYDEK